MVPSKPPTDVLGLGKHLVRELGLEDGIDTLARWMSHYVAELIHEAENAPTEEKRSLAARKATGIILMIWDHRVSLPGRAYPLKSYENVITALNCLRPDNDDFGPHRYKFDTDQGYLAAILFDDFARLIVGILFLNLDSLEQRKKIDPLAVEALEEEEKTILAMLQKLNAVFISEAKAKSRSKKKQKKAVLSEFDLAEIIIRRIDSITTKLAKLKEELVKAKNTIPNG
jgi:hypothetical protein